MTAYQQTCLVLLRKSRHSLPRSLAQQRRSSYGPYALNFRLPPSFFKACSSSPNLLTRSLHATPDSATFWNTLTVFHLFPSPPSLQAMFPILLSFHKNSSKLVWTLLGSWSRMWRQRQYLSLGIAVLAAKRNAFNRRGANWRLCPKILSMASSRDPPAPSALVEIAGHLWIPLVLVPPLARKQIRTPSCRVAETLVDSCPLFYLVVDEYQRLPNLATARAAEIRCHRFVRYQVPQTRESTSLRLPRARGRLA